jgi:hypothetical protein
MAIVNARACVYPEDLEAAAFALEQEVGDQVAAVTEILKAAVEAANATSAAAGGATLDQLLDQGNDIINKLLAGNDSDIKSASDLEDLLGLPKAELTQEDEEISLFYAGITMVDGVVYAPASSPKLVAVPPNSTVLSEAPKAENYEPGVTQVSPGELQAQSPAKGEALAAKIKSENNQNNIEILRRLYFACGRNLELTEELVKSQQGFIIKDRLHAKQGQPNTNLEGLKSYFGNHLTDDDIAALDVFPSDAQVHKRNAVLLRDFSAVDGDSKGSGLTEFPASQAMYSVFHVGAIDNSPQANTKYANAGFSGVELSSILAGQDLAQTTSGKTALDSDIANNQAVTLGLIRNLDFLMTHLKEFGDNAPQFALIESGLANIRKTHEEIMCRANFQVTTILQPDTIDRLREQHDDAGIKYLLERRREVKSIDFDATTEQIIKILQKAANAGPGSSTVSTAYLNSTDAAVYSKKVLLTMHTFLLNAESMLAHAKAMTIAHGPQQKFRKLDLLNRARGYLVRYAGSSPKIQILDPEEKVFEDPAEKELGPVTAKKYKPKKLVGVKSQGSAAQSLVAWINPAKTFKVLEKIENVELAAEKSSNGLLDALIGALKAIINVITMIFNAIINAIKALVSAATGLIAPLKQKLDSFIAKYLTLTGGGAFNSSLLKCAVSFDLGLNFALLDELLKLINNIGALALGLVAKIADFVNGLLNKLLCIPLDLLSGFLGALNSLLPPFCATPKFSLPPELEAALGELKLAADGQGYILQQMGKDLIKFKASLSAAPLKGGPFKTGASCGGQSSSNFFQAAQLNASKPEDVPKQNVGKLKTKTSETAGAGGT